MSMSEGSEQGSRGKRRHRQPSEKYDNWLQRVRGEVTMAEAASQHQVDRSVIVKVRQVAQEGALAGSRPGLRDRRRDHQMEAIAAENARLSETVKELAIKLMLAERKERWI
jgi:transposase